ncbi:MAG: polyhydroxyalkanoate depolymerase [Alphaproteobacteria bacterium]|nr:polyhydroxyalkanoate depolymerase [Alphaproteobacteria bacterium]
MLYQIYETQRSLMEPFADFARAASKLYSNPLSPLGQTSFSQRMSAACDLMYRLGKDYEKPVFGIKSVPVDGVEVVIHERIEVDKPFCELRRFKRFSDDAATLNKLKGQPVVLVVAPLSGHYATLLRDTVRTMLGGHKVYITDWKNARMVPLEDGEFHLDDYVNYVQEFIRYLQGQYGNVHIMSVCQPTVPVLAAVSLMASRGEKTPLSMTMMGGPIDASRSPTAVNNLAMNKSFQWFENNMIYRVPSNFPGAGRRVYPGFLQHTGFVAMNPDRHLSSHYDYFLDLIKGDNSSAESHRQFYDEYNAVLDMDADYYLETIQTVFQEFKLVNGSWDVKNPQGEPERVCPQDIKTTALLTIEGELDDISGSGQTEAAHGLCASIPESRSHHLEVQGAGHYGIFSGRHWREVVYPCVCAFILENNDDNAPKTRKTSNSVTKAAPKRSSRSARSATNIKAPARKTTARTIARRARA